MTINETSRDATQARAVVEAASCLISEDDENPEYDRALVEMTCTLLGLSTGETDNRAGVEWLLRNWRLIY